MIKLKEVIVPEKNNYPKGFSTFQQIYELELQKIFPTQNKQSYKDSLELICGLQGSFGDVVRFASRYRLACSFKGMILEGYIDKTVTGYNSLMQLFLLWGAFEQFAKLLGYGSKKSLDYVKIDTNLFSKYDYSKLEKIFLKNDSKGILITFLYKHANRTDLKARLADYLPQGAKWGSMPPLASLLSACRHMFAHGKLTPRVGAIGEANIKRIVDEIVVFLITVMDEEFSQVVANMGK